MPQGLPTTLDLAKLEAGIGYNLIEENIALSPELSVIPADTMDGDMMELTVRTDLPIVGFRNANEGTPRSKSGFTTRVFQTAILDHQVAIDQALADKRKPKAKARFLESHSSGAVEAAFRLLSKQFYYGVGNDAKGFVGLIAQYLADSDHEVNVTGTTSKTSVWFLKLGRENVEYLWGNQKTLGFDKAWKTETVYDENNDPYQAYTNWMKGNAGLRLANKHAAVRIKNIGTGAGKTLTYEHMHSALRKFTDLGWQPDLILMNSRSREQLRQELITPENKNPSVPKTFEEITIQQTSHIINGETI